MDIVHGAIASLIDTAGVVAVWSNSPDVTRATASMTVNYLSGRASDLLAEARVIAVVVVYFCRG